MFDNGGLIEWYSTVFEVRNCLTPSEIENMPYIEFKVYLMMLNKYIEEKNKR